MRTKIIIWTVAILITLLAVFYQRSTGPTYPRKFKIEIAGEDYNFKLKRSHVLSRDFYVSLDDIPLHVEGVIHYKPYPTNLDWQSVDLQREGSTLKGKLPVQPAAGKLAYNLILKDGNKDVYVAKEEPVIIRFRGDVPAVYMIPHIFLMFLAMLFSNATGLLVAFKQKKYKKYLIISFILLVAGGLIFGPIIQKFAFGDYWTGWPFGKDLTDNKTLISFVFYLIAVLGNIKKDRPYLALIAAIVLILIYSIPHSMMGSEYDYASGNVITG